MAKDIKESFDHDDCPKCGTASEPAENVPDQALRDCPKCGHQWFEELNEPPKKGSRKVFNEMQNVGRVKYLVNFHDGEKTHDDGSPFFDVQTFSNKRKKAKFVKGLLEQGYKQK